jgi:hypothetical protein
MTEQKPDERVIKVGIVIVAGDLSVKAEGTMDEMETIRVLQFAIDAMEQQIMANAKIEQISRLTIPGFERGN